MNIVQEAAVFAYKAHEGQVRKYTGVPYFTHLLAVAALVWEAGGDDAMVAAAFLHDVLEDTPTTYLDLVNAFGHEVASLVSEVTDVSRPEDGNRKVRKALDRDHLAKASPRAQTIKYADFFDNTPSIAKYAPGFAVKYLREKAEALAVMTDGDPDLRARAALFIG